MVTMSILWDEKTDLQKRLSEIIADYQKQITSCSDVASVFVGLATGSDKELLHLLINLPSEIRSELLEYIQNYVIEEDIPEKRHLDNFFLPLPIKTWKFLSIVPQPFRLLPDLSPLELCFS